MRILMAICLLTSLASRAHGQAAIPKPVLRLSLKDAVAMALSPEGNVRLQIARELILQAQDRSAQSRAALLPNVDAYVTEQNITRNLAAFGLNPQRPVIGAIFPTLVGPFTVFDARATATQTVLDLSAIRRYQASRAAVSQVQTERASAEDQVRDQVARLYLAALRARTMVNTANANVTLAEALVKQAKDQKLAGTGTGLDVARAEVQLANERQRLLVTSNELDRAQLQLLRAMGVNLEATLELTEPMAYIPFPAPPLEDAVRKALESRADWKAQQKREETARLNASATKLERVPSVNLFGDYGTTGLGTDQIIPTRIYGVTVRVPFFDGGRRDARRSESASQLRQETIRTRDLRAQIELEIRLALDSMRSAEDQVKTAEEGLRLSRDEFARAQRRYGAGMGSSLEVTDAQTRLERAQDNRIQALFNHSLARIDLNTAMGTIESLVDSR
jgi:outer membrane protein